MSLLAYESFRTWFSPTVESRDQIQVVRFAWVHLHHEPSCLLIFFLFYFNKIPVYGWSHFCLAHSFTDGYFSYSYTSTMLMLLVYVFCSLMPVHRCEIAQSHAHFILALERRHSIPWFLFCSFSHCSSCTVELLVPHPYAKVSFPFFFCSYPDEHTVSQHGFAFS